MSRSRILKLRPLLHVAKAGFSGLEAVGIALEDQDTVSELLHVPPNARESKLNAIGWSNFSAKKCLIFFTALEGPGEIAGISRLHLHFSVHIFTLPYTSFNAHAARNLQ